MLSSNNTEFVIKGKIESKSEYKSWLKGDKELSKFSFILADNTSKIEVLAWGKSNYDK